MLKLSDKFYNSHWFRHNLVDFVPIEALESILGHYPDELVEDTNFDLKTPCDVLQDVLDNGMDEPFVVLVDLCRFKLTLASGNNRLPLLKSAGIKLIPTTVQVWNRSSRPPYQLSLGQKWYELDEGDLKIVVDTRFLAEYNPLSILRMFDN